MTTKLELKFDRRTERYLERWARTNPSTLRKALVEFLDVVASRLAGRTVKEYLSGQRLKVRTGTLRRSIIGRGVTIGGVPGFKMGVFRGPATEYARIQEFGGVVEQKPGGPALAIPKGPALTPAGVHRYNSPREFPGGLKFIPFRGSGAAIGGLFPKEDVEKERRRGGDFNIRNLRLAYLLMRRVRLPARHFLRDAGRLLLPLVIEELDDKLRTIVLEPGKRIQ